MSKFHAFKADIKQDIQQVKLEYKYAKHLVLNKDASLIERLKSLWKFATYSCVNEDMCLGDGHAYLEHGNCAYQDEMSNYFFLCADCHNELDRMYSEMWEEYYSGRL